MAEILISQLQLLLFVSRYPLQPTERHDHRKQQVQFCVLRHQGLHKEYTALRV